MLFFVLLLLFFFGGVWLFVFVIRGRHGRDSMVVGFYNYLCNQFLPPLTLLAQLPLRRCVLDTTLCDKFVSDLRQVGVFLRVLRFPPAIRLTATI